MTPFPAQPRRLFELERVGAGPFLLATDALIEGPLDCSRFAMAVQAVRRRHEALRTAVYHTTDGPMQRVLPDAPLPAILTLDGCDDDAFAQAIAEEGARQVAALLDKPQSSLVQVTLIRRSADITALVCTVHHAVLDTYALKVIVEDMFSLYFSQPLPPPALQFSDIARREAEYFNSARAEASLEFWRKELARPAASVWPAGPAHAGGATFHFLPDEAIEAAEAIARQAETGLLSVLLAAAWVSLAPRFGPGMRIGVPVANRLGAAEKASVGLMAHSLPLFVDLSDATTGLQALHKCGKILRAAFRHSRVPVSMLMERLRPDEYLLPHELSLAQVNLFPWEAAPLPGGLTFSPLLQRPVATGAMDGLNVVAVRQDGGMLLSIGHAGTVSETDAEVFAESFAAALSRLTDEPGACLLPK